MIKKYSNGEISKVIEKTQENASKFEKLIENEDRNLKKEGDDKSIKPFWAPENN